MAAKKRVEENEADLDGQLDYTETAESSDFYENEIAIFSEAVERDLDRAFEQYGFSLYHSLPAAKQIPLSQKLGFFRNDGIDHYNLAGLQLAEGNIEEGARLLEKAIELDPSIADAYHNLALCYEKLDRKSDALKTWNKCREVCEDEESAKAIDSHLAELGS